MNVLLKRLFQTLTFQKKLYNILPACFNIASTVGHLVLTNINALYAYWLIFMN